jgi:hypothetical protein
MGGLMIKGKNITVSALYDSGNFMHFSVSANIDKRYSKYNGNIVECFNLNDDDMEILSGLIAIAVDKYIEERTHEVQA